MNDYYRKLRINDLEIKLMNLKTYLVLAPKDVIGYIETRLSYEEKQLEYFELTGKYFQGWTPDRVSER